MYRKFLQWSFAELSASIFSRSRIGTDNDQSGVINSIRSEQYAFTKLLYG